MIELASFIVVVVSCLLFSSKRLLRYLRYFQQEEYQSKRFLHWLARNYAFDRRGTIIVLGAGILSVVMREEWQIGINIVAGLCAIALFMYEEDPRKSGKLKLKMTDRAKRIFVCAVGISAFFAFLLIVGVVRFRSPLGAGLFWLFAAAIIQATPASLVLANALLLPGELKRQQFFRDDAQLRLREISPYVVGITGSYGKTSTKAILGEMLPALGPTLWPSGSINTPMGITRYIRENLRSSHQYAVFEMGAYGEGSIKRLCDLVHPSAGVITAIGVMHLERFGSEDAVFRAKSELAQALPADGILVLNGDDEKCRKVAELYPRKTTLFYGLDHASHPLDCFMDEICFSPAGTSFSLCWGGARYKGQTGLLGRPALYNILAAFTLASALGADPDYLLAKARTLKPQSNRLELVKGDGDVWFLQDAYNSNPIGFRAALEVLAALPAKRRILVTPGMVELGLRQEIENYNIAVEAAQVCDMVFIVGEENRNALLSGLRNNDRSLVVQNFAGRDDALAELRRIVLPGDVVLVENDLPDLYDRPKF